MRKHNIDNQPHTYPDGVVSSEPHNSIQAGSDPLEGSAPIELLKDQVEMDKKTDSMVKLDTPRIRKIYQCQGFGCDFRGNMLKVRKHILSKHVSYRYICPHSGCSHHFSSNNFLRRHVRTQHPYIPLSTIPELSQEQITQLIEPFMPQVSISNKAQPEDLI